MILSCQTQELTLVKPKLSIDQILGKAKGARKTTLSYSDIAKSWKFSAYHDQANNPYTPDAYNCLANVVWNLNETFDGTSIGIGTGHFWQVLNFGPSGCSNINRCNAQYTFFLNWVVSSGYNSYKRYVLFSYENGDSGLRLIEDGTDDECIGRNATCHWTVVDNYYLVIYPEEGGDLIFTLNQ